VSDETRVKMTAKSKTETEALFCDLDKPSLHALSYALRHPDTWPRSFVWDYKKCDQCAMGLAHGLWGTIAETTPDTGASVMAREFAIPFTSNAICTRWAMAKPSNARGIK
jgi:hypothetical protein